MYKCFLKRFFDMLFSLLFLPFVVALIALLGILIKLDDGGTIFYCSKRLGKEGCIFNMYKLRTMKTGAPDLRNKDGSTYNSLNDPRITRVGRILRKTSLDEIPQLFNILFGKMSFIGPRPDLPDHYNYYDSLDVKKLDVLPGISGFNQAYFRNTLEWKYRLKNDVYYVENLSFVLDIKILFKTLSIVLIQKGVYKAEKRKMLEGLDSNGYFEMQ